MRQKIVAAVITLAVLAYVIAGIYLTVFDKGG